MDLNQLLRAHQLSLMRLDRAGTAEERASHAQFAQDYAASIQARRLELGAKGAVLKITSSETSE